MRTTPYRFRDYIIVVDFLDTYEDGDRAHFSNIWEEKFKELIEILRAIKCKWLSST